MLKYNSATLGAEERFDDPDYAEYEIADYKDPEPVEEEWEEDIDKPSVRESYKKRKDSNIPEEYLNLYTRNVEIEDEEKSKERYVHLRDTVLYGTPEQRAAANEEACLYMKGLILRQIKRSYSTYIQKDPDYVKELMDEAFYNIVKYLPKYDPEKGQPSTFFWFHINSALATTTTQVKHNMSSSDSALKRKIYALYDEYEKRGLTLTASDIMVETNETMSKVLSVLKIMNIDLNTHLEAIEEYDQLIAGDPEFNQAYETPEKTAIQRVTVESIIKRAYEMFPHEKVDIYLRNKMNGESIQELVDSFRGQFSDDKIRRIIEEVQHGLHHDWKVRKLGSGYIRDDDDNDPFALPILPVKGQDENMDLLELLPV